MCAKSLCYTLEDIMQVLECQDLDSLDSGQDVDVCITYEELTKTISSLHQTQNCPTAKQYLTLIPIHNFALQYSSSIESIDFITHQPVMYQVSDVIVTFIVDTPNLFNFCVLNIDKRLKINELNRVLLI